MPYYISKKSLGLRRLGKVNQVFNSSFTFEATTGSIRSVCFDMAVAKRMPNWKKRKFVTDFIPITIPPGLQWVPDPLGGTEADYDPSAAGKFEYVVRDHGAVNKKPTNVFLLDGVRRPQDSDNDGGELVDSPSEYLDLCEIFIRNLNLAGSACSTAVGRYETGNNDPLTFYLSATGLKGSSTQPVPAGDKVKDDLDHFLVLQKMPNNSVVWIAIPRQDDPAVNASELARYALDNHEMVAFNSELVFYDDLGMLISFVAEPLANGEIVPR